MDHQDIDLTIYPGDCDAFGHLNQASFLSLFERARWDLLARGPGMDVFSRHGLWPAVRRTTIDYRAAAYPGDVLRFHVALTHVGRTSFTLRQAARRRSDDALIATAEFVFVCINREGRPVPVPPEAAAGFGPSPDPGEAIQQITVRGAHLAVEVAGSGPAVLFIHGYPLDRSIWRHQIDSLDGFRRIAPDLRGMGRSAAPDLGYSMATYAEDLAGVLEALGEESAVLCGLSMGGYIAFEFLRRWPDRVRGLILMDTRAEGDSEDGRKGRDQQIALAKEQGAGAIASAMVPKLLAKGADARLVRQVRAMIEATPVAGIVGALTAIRDRSDSRALLPELGRMPVLVVTGSEDAIIPAAQARALAEAIPGAEFAEIAGAGHLPCLEAPEATTRVLREWLGG
jgi:YbgC/YbaW family acyl-CoA thioester hydrolase